MIFLTVYNFAQKISVNTTKPFLTILMILLTSEKEIQLEKTAGEAGCGPEGSYSKN